MPRKTDSHNPADWLFIVESDLDMIRASVERDLAHISCRSKLAETLEKVMKAELIRLGWTLKKTHELEVLVDELRALDSDLTSQVETLATDLAEAYFTDRYPGFDLDDPDWPKLRAQLATVTALAATIRGRLP